MWETPESDVTPSRPRTRGAEPRRGFHAPRRMPRRGSDCRKSLHTRIGAGRGAGSWQGNIFEQITNSSGTVLYVHHDQQGSTRLLTSSTGTKEASFTYDAYGNQTGHTGTTTTPLGYDGQYTNADTGLIYLRAREYDPATSQFMSIDPADEATRAPYSYGLDNPVSQGDPTGLTPWSPQVQRATARCAAWRKKTGSPYWRNQGDYHACQDLLHLPSQVFGTNNRNLVGSVLHRFAAAAQDLVALGWEGAKAGFLEGCALGASSAAELDTEGQAGVCLVSGSAGAVLVGVPTGAAGAVFGALSEEKIAITGP